MSTYTHIYIYTSIQRAAPPGYRRGTLSAAPWPCRSARGGSAGAQSPRTSAATAGRKAPPVYMRWCVYRHDYMHEYQCVHAHVCACTCMHAHMQPAEKLHMDTHIRVRSRTRALSCVRACVRVQIYTACIHPCTHTHTHICNKDVCVCIHRHIYYASVAVDQLPHRIRAAIYTKIGK